MGKLFGLAFGALFFSTSPPPSSRRRRSCSLSVETGCGGVLFRCRASAESTPDAACARHPAAAAAPPVSANTRLYASTFCGFGMRTTGAQFGSSPLNGCSIDIVEEGAQLVEVFLRRGIVLVIMADRTTHSEALKRCRRPLSALSRYSTRSSSGMVPPSLLLTQEQTSPAAAITWSRLHGGSRSPAICSLAN